MLTFALGATTFVFFPTYVKPASLEGSDMFSLLLRAFHEGWGRYAALPSGHVYITTLLALFYSRWYPRYKSLWILILVIVSLATLFTGQHYILDVLGGYLVALAGYYFGLWWTRRQETQKRTKTSLVFLELIARSEKLLYSPEHGTDKNHPPEISKRIRG
jgi:membrane-associated phospholipid phosphatase